MSSKMVNNLLDAVMKHGKTRALNLIPIFGGGKMIVEIFRNRQFISDSKTPRLGHSIAAIGNIGAFAVPLYSLLTNDYQGQKTNTEFIYELLSGGGLFMVVSKIGHIISIGTEFGVRVLK